MMVIIPPIKCLKTQNRKYCCCPILVYLVLALTIVLKICYTSTFSGDTVGIRRRGSINSNESFTNISLDPDAKIIPHSFNQESQQYTIDYIHVKYYNSPVAIPSFFGKREDRCHECFKVTFDYIINNEHVCVTKSNEDVDIIITIFSPPSHTVQRRALRKAWLSPVLDNTGRVRYIFLLGAELDADNHPKILLEKHQHGDIVQSNIIDNYRSLTYKAIVALHWVKNFCRNAKYYIKTDDDCWINIDKLAERLRGDGDVYSRVLGGACASHRKPARYSNSKWYTNVDEYPRDEYPPYCSGMGYVFGQETLSKMLIMSENVPPIRWEDVYIGLIAEQLGLKTVRIPGFEGEYRTTNLCTFRTNLIIAHFGPLLTPQQIVHIWKNCKSISDERGRGHGGIK